MRRTVRPVFILFFWVVVVVAGVVVVSSGEGLDVWSNFTGRLVWHLSSCDRHALIVSRIVSIISNHASVITQSGICLWGYRDWMRVCVCLSGCPDACVPLVQT